MSDETTNDAIDPKRAAREAEARTDAKIEQLERALADEREHSAGLRNSVNELRFQMEILEKSYSKQLDDARSRAVAAEKRADEQQIRVAELDSARLDAIQLLTEAKAEIDRLSSRPRQRANPSSVRNDPTGTRNHWPAERVDEDDVLSDEGTINTLLDDAKWVRDKAPAEALRLKAEAEAKAAEEAGREDMLSPDLVFTAKAADN